MQCAWVVARSYEVSLHTAVLADGLLGGFNRLAVDALGGCPAGGVGFPLNGAPGTLLAVLRHRSGLLGVTEPRAFDEESDDEDCIASVVGRYILVSVSPNACEDCMKEEFHGSERSH